jgi:hypothetical protein
MKRAYETVCPDCGELKAGCCDDCGSCGCQGNCWCDGITDESGELAAQLATIPAGF